MYTIALMFLVTYIILKLRDQKLFSIYLDYLLAPEEEEEETEPEENINLRPEKAEKEN